MKTQDNGRRLLIIRHMSQNLQKEKKFTKVGSTKIRLQKQDWDSNLDKCLNSNLNK